MKINFYKILIRSPLLLIAPEIVWKIADLALTQKWFWSFISKIFMYSHPKLNTNFAGIELDSPVGLAAGYDKNCKYLSSLETFGFGYLIGGTVTFDPRPGNPKPRMIRIPKEKASSSGLRKLSNKNRLSRALDVLAEKPSIKKDMWIKRAKEYEKNINSGDPVLIAEVVRDLNKKEDSLEQQSYSERQIYLTALNRLSNEYAAVQNLEKKMAKNKLEELLNQ